MTDDGFPWGLVSPLGPVSEVVLEPSPWGLPDVSIASAWVGSGWADRPLAGEPLGARGQSWDGAAHACLLAIAEACERYAGYFVPSDLKDAAACELPGRPACLSSIPRCSPMELADSRCPVRTADPDARIRWAAAVEVLSGEPAWVPAVMVTKGLTDVRPDERFALPVSTGHAVHTNRVAAVTNALLEVVERDSVATSWLERVQLPQLVEQQSARATALLHWGNRHGVETRLFDATSDIGIPTVLALQLAPHDSWFRYLTCAASAASSRDAAEKVLLEMVAFRHHPVDQAFVPATPDQFALPIDAARWMGQEGRRDGFRHLLDGPRPVSHGHDLDVSAECPENVMRAVMARLAATVSAVYVVDLSPPELLDVGLHHVVAVIPDLQPISLHPFVHYRGHPRLAQAARAWSSPVRTEMEMNPWPQPFP